MPQYIDKSALVAEIERRIKELQDLFKEDEKKLDSFQKTAINLCIDECKVILNILDTLEVKGVDLDSDIRTYLTNHFNIYEDGVLQSKKSGLPLSTYDIIKVAKHFFELGLKTQKGEQQ